MQYDLLLNPGRFVWAVNARVEEDSVRIGALYLEPNVPDPNIRLTHNDEHFDVELPEEYLGRSYAQRAWNVDLPLVKADS